MENLILREGSRTDPGSLAQWLTCCVMLSRSVAALDLCYLLGGGGTQHEGLKDEILSDEGKLVKAAPTLFSRKCGILVTQFEIF